jgi:hypothetical protein
MCPAGSISQNLLPIERPKAGDNGPAVGPQRLERKQQFSTLIVKLMVENV